MSEGPTSEGRNQEPHQPLTEGQTVYFVEPNNALGAQSPDFTLEVKKACVEDVGNRQFPILIIWRDLDKEPEIGMSVAKSPKELFTPEEVQDLASEMKEFADAGVDDLVRDSSANRKLAFALSSIVQERVKDNPNNL